MCERPSLAYVLAVAALAAVVLVILAASSDTCREHGERFVGHSDWGNTLCRRPDGTVVAR